MKIDEATTLANTLLAEHGLTDWQVKVDKAKRRFGRCAYRTKTINLSRPLTELNEEQEVRDTILHEIAHALVGPRQGHNEVWKRKATEIGARPQRCYANDKVMQPPAKYQGQCPTCARTIQRHVRRDIACGRCSGKRYDPQHRFVWTLQNQITQ